MYKLGEDLGRLFEVGFNSGILAYIQENEISHPGGDLYRRDLRQLKLHKIMEVICERTGVHNQLDRQTIEQWVTYFILRAFLAGRTFFQEYLETMSRKKPEILYFQCEFYNENSLNTHTKKKLPALIETLSQLNLPDVNAIIGRYNKKKGEFIQADTLLWLAYPKEHRILTIDLSIFFIREIRDLQDLNEIEVLRRLLKYEVNYIRSKSVFSELSLDTELGEMPFSEGLARYFKAFVRQDKETAKFIQAASYAYSFYDFLRNQNLLDERPVYFNVVGYSDRGVSAMALSQKQLELLRICREIYQKKRKEDEINEIRQKVLDNIRNKARRAFEVPHEGEAFLNDLLTRDYRAQSGVTVLRHREQLSDFTNTGAQNIPPELATTLQLEQDTLRNAHAALITRALTDTHPIIFLTGNPGIGKTTAIVDFLEAHSGDGFLFLYVSPRKQVNLDIIEKFKEKDIYQNDNTLLLNSNSILIADHGGIRPTVQYFSNVLDEGNFTARSVQFIDARTDNQHKRSSRPSSVDRKGEDRLQGTKAANIGVLASISQALFAVISDQLSNNIVATVSIQSLKKTRGGQSTLKHLKTIFQDALIEDHGIIISEKLQAISQRIKHLFIMIDEITGDESGVAFLQGVRDFAHELELFEPRHGFNTKIIVADASIVDTDVIKQHLRTKSPERDKIFFRQANAGAEILSYQPFEFKDQQAIMINANSYPASELTLTYKVLITAVKYNKQTLPKYKDYLEDSVDQNLLNDIFNLLERPDADQLIVYIQDKQRLLELIGKIQKNQQAKGQQFGDKQEYLEIHADLSETQKEELQGYKDNVKVIFMTSSASRGLSFPNARHLLIVIPMFAIEQNLMEIIQVIYRGRGGPLELQEKELTFYLAERVIYGETEEEYQVAIQKRLFNVINLLLILKTSIMSRIRGYGKIGLRKYLMVPVGGKSISTAGNSFSSRMSTLLKALEKEQYKQPGNRTLKMIHERIASLFTQSRTQLQPVLSKKEQQTGSYLKLLHTFESSFVEALRRGFDRLLTLEPLEHGYISGSLLIVPLAGRRVDQSIKMSLWNQLQPILDEGFIRQMNQIAHSEEYPESLRSAMQYAIDLVEQLYDALRVQGVGKSQRFEQSSQRGDLYYAIPLFAMVSSKALEKYFATSPEEPEKESFRELLSLYIRALYPADGILPIGTQYGKFPFILFKSESLAEIRSKLFTDRQLLSSNELNVLNLILSNSKEH